MNARRRTLLPLLAGLPFAVWSAAPNFIVVLGEGHGWSSTSVRMDDAVPESKSAVARTPNLERLAREGMRFATFYAPSPRCTPSRARRSGRARATPCTFRTTTRTGSVRPRHSTSATSS